MLIFSVLYPLTVHYSQFTSSSHLNHFNNSAANDFRLRNGAQVLKKLTLKVGQQPVEGSQNIWFVFKVCFGSSFLLGTWKNGHAEPFIGSQWWLSALAYNLNFLSYRNARSLLLCTSREVQPRHTVCSLSRVINLDGCTCFRFPIGWNFFQNIYVGRASLIKQWTGKWSVFLKKNIIKQLLLYLLLLLEMVSIHFLGRSK